MSPTPVTFATPNQPSSYTWEATNEEVSARYGVPIDDVVRFDLNTAPAPPDIAQRVMSAGRFHVSLSEYPPADYRRLVEAAAERYGVGMDEIVVGAGADEILDVIAKTFLAEGSRAIVPIPTYAMFRVLTEQRGAQAVLVPRLGAGEGYALESRRPSGMPLEMPPWSGCAHPTTRPRSPSPTARSRRCSGTSRPTP